MNIFLEQLRTLNLPDANVKVEELCGIVDCFSSEEEKEHFIYSCGESLECVFHQYDGLCRYEWRSGIKHDCAPILELTFQNGKFYNGLGEQVEIEQELIYPYLKSSDVAKYSESEEWEFRKYILVPHRYVGETSSFIQSEYPKAYNYLLSHIDFFTKRKSSIYKGKDAFSIFGIGDYTFAPYKIVVSSLYKEIRFKALSPYKGKPIVIDDTCYQLAFDSVEIAVGILRVLESKEIMSLLKAITFNDAKRVVTKNLLMRIDIDRYLEQMGMQKVDKSRNPIVIQPSLF